MARGFPLIKRKHKSYAMGKVDLNNERDALLEDVEEVNNSNNGTNNSLEAISQNNSKRKGGSGGGRHSRRSRRRGGNDIMDSDDSTTGHLSSSGSSSNTNSSDGPHMLTMLFIAVALATVFNMSKSGRPDPATVIYKSDAARVQYKASLRNAAGMSAIPASQQQQQVWVTNPASQQQMLQQQQYLQQQMQTQQASGYNVFNPMQLPQQTVGNRLVPTSPMNTGAFGGLGTPTNNMILNNDNMQQEERNNNDQEVVTSAQEAEETSEENVEENSEPEDVAEVSTEVSPKVSELNQESQEQPVAKVEQVEPPQPQAPAQPIPAQHEVEVDPATGYNPRELKGFKDTWDPPSPGDQPVFFHIPKSGGSTIKDIMGTCHRFIQASEAGVVEGHDQDTQLAVVRPGENADNQDPSPFVNCDATTIEGIKRCANLGLAQSNLADFIVSPYIFELDQVFKDDNFKGRLFTIFRHPVDRAVSMFYYIQIATWEPTYNPKLAEMSLAEYATSDFIENNWMTRQLSGVYDGDLTQEHLQAAMDVIRRKFLVGLLSEKEKSMERFEKFFKWKFRVNPENQEKCRETLLAGGSNSNSNNKKEKPQPGDPTYELIAGQNLYDIEVFKYIESLFKEQEQFVAAVPDGFRKIDATCAKCVPPTFPFVEASAAAAADVPDVPMVAPGELSPLPEDRILSGFKDITEPFEVTDQPIFWHIPKAGGSTVKDIMGTCHRFTQASEAGIAEGHDQDLEIAVVRPGGVPADQDPSPFVNCDASTIQGIARCAKLGLAESNLADFIASPYVYEAHQLFNEKAKGRLFTVFRHPVDRAVSMFFYIQIADWEPTYNPDLAKMTLSEYALSPQIENNWMTRTLTQAYSGEIGDEHLELAKDIIKRKFLVGLLKEKVETMERVEKFFRFKFRVNPENQEKCREKLLTGGSNSNAKNKQEKPKPGDEAYELIAQQNVYDIKLYEHIEEQFQAQRALFANIPDGFRTLDASCAKCVPPTFPGV